MTTLLISEVAEQTGFSTTTLRYYEAIGLLPPPERTAAGYRTYREDAVRRLHLIARAKALGLSLDEVRDLAVLWGGEPCAAVQEHLGHVLVAKAAEGRARLLDLQSFVVALDQAVVALGEPAPTGPCTDACACFKPTDPDATSSGAAAPDDVDACSLDPMDVGRRLEEWRELLSRGEVATSKSSLVARFGVGIRLLEVAELVEAERRCCGFLSFSLATDGSETVLRVTAPAGREEVLEAMAASSG